MKLKMKKFIIVILILLTFLTLFIAFFIMKDDEEQNIKKYYNDYKCLEVVNLLEGITLGNNKNPNTYLIPINENFNKENLLLGELPKNDHEVIIYKKSADNIIKNGILIEKRKDNKLVNTNYKPVNYEELIESKEKIVFGNSYVIIVGIIKDECVYDALIDSNKLDKECNNTFKKFEEVYGEYIFIVTNNFQNSLKYNFSANITRLNDDINIIREIKLTHLNRSDEFYNGEEYITQYNIKDDEVIIDLYLLDTITHGEFGREYLEFLKISNSLSFKDLKTFVKTFIDKKNIIGTTLDFKINDNYYNPQDKAFKSFIVKGVHLNNYNHKTLTDDNKDYFYNDFQNTLLYIKRDHLNDYYIRDYFNTIENISDLNYRINN